MASGALSDVDFGDYAGAFDGDFTTIQKFDYYLHEDGNAGFDLYAFDEAQQLDEGFLTFCWDIFLQVWPNIWISLIACLTWRIFQGIFGLILNHVAALNYLSVLFEVLLNCLSVALGVILLRHFFGDLCLRLCAFIFTIGLILSSNAYSRVDSSPGDEAPISWTYPMIFVTASCLLLQMYCEFFLDSRDWHMIRGTAMILAMKAVSVSALRIRMSTFTGSSFNLSFLRHYLSWCGYAFSPGTVIFGPWFSFDNYLRAIQLVGSTSLNSLLYRDLLQTAVSCAIAIGCIIYSAYLSSIIHAVYFLSFRWTNAYAQSQSFRFSHYFVSFFSQSMYQAIGFATIAQSKSHQSYVTAMVTNPISVELPRSLVDVVVHWNFPMHFWLKQYIYKPTRRFGQLPALLLTYAFSSLLHGLNFQLAAVLFSIGVYAYIDFVLREKLARRMDACVGARACSQKCRHKNKSTCLWVRVVNLFFSGLAIFHLAYLAVMFDTSEQQDKGYNMFHVLEKWSNLYFLSHIIAALSYVFSLVV